MNKDIDLTDDELAAITSGEEVTQPASKLDEVMPPIDDLRADTKNGDINAVLGARRRGREKLDADEAALDAQGPSYVQENAPLMKGILAAGRGFVELNKAPTSGLDAATKNIDDQVAADNAKSKALRDRLMQKRERLDEPVKDMSLKNRLLGESRKERVESATEKAVTDKPTLENKRLEGDIQNQNIRNEASQIGIDDTKADRDAKSTRSVEYRRQIADALEKEATGMDNAKQPAEARRAREEARRILNSELSRFDLEKYPMPDGISAKDYLSDQRLRETAEENRKAREASTGASKESKANNETEKNTQKLSKRLTEEGIPGLQSQMGEIDGYLNKYGSVDKIDGMGRAARTAPGWAYNLVGSEEGKGFRQALQGAANSLIKSRSGAAVTTAEEKRLMLELGQGTFSSPQQVEKGINAIRNVYNKMTQNIGGGFSEETKGAYKDQGGISLSPLSDPRSSAPATGLSKSNRKQLGSADELP